MSEVTMKSTKQEIMDAYLAAKRKLDTMSAMNYDPSANEKLKAAEARAKAAENIASKGILNEEITAQYEALKETVSDLEARLKELHGIEAEANSMVALINAHRVKEQELKDKYNAMEAELKKTHDEKVAIFNQEVLEYLKKKNEALEAIKLESNELKKQIDQERRREVEEYKYNLTRTRRIENDKWEDEKASRERELAIREADLSARTEVIKASEKNLAELEAKVASIPKLIDEAYRLHTNNQIYYRFILNKQHKLCTKQNQK